MRKIKIKKGHIVSIQYLGPCGEGSVVPCRDDLAKHIVENMQMADYQGKPWKDEAEENAKAARLVQDKSDITQEQIIGAISEIDQEDESLWTSENKPTVEAISEIVGSYITAAQRDEAFALFIQT